MRAVRGVSSNTKTRRHEEARGPSSSGSSILYQVGIPMMRPMDGADADTDTDADTDSDTDADADTDVLNDETLQGRTPNTLPEGDYDVEVINPDGDNAYLPAAFTITADESCGCATGRSSGAWAGALLISLLVVTRRRRAYSGRHRSPAPQRGPLGTSRPLRCAAGPRDPGPRLGRRGSESP